MKQFMAGDIGPGEMGCGIELMVLTNAMVTMRTPNTIHISRLKPKIEKIMSVSTLNGDLTINKTTLPDKYLKYMQCIDSL